MWKPNKRRPSKELVVSIFKGETRLWNNLTPRAGKKPPFFGRCARLGCLKDHQTTNEKWVSDRPEQVLSLASSGRKYPVTPGRFRPPKHSLRCYLRRPGLGKLSPTNGGDTHTTFVMYGACSGGWTGPGIPTACLWPPRRYCHTRQASSRAQRRPPRGKASACRSHRTRTRCRP